MSYILEALKKSQQERELGQIPTLETPTFPAEEPGTRPSFWILLAVTLAVLAVVIAAYLTLRGSIPTPEPEAARVEPLEHAAPGQAGQDADTALEPATSSGDSRTVAAVSRPRRPARAPSVQDPGPTETAAAAMVEPPAAPARSQPPLHESSVAEETPANSGPERVSKAPPDLVADIEAFKREVREEESGLTKAAKAEAEVAPEDLRLPKEVRKRLPELVMSAHIYDKDPSKRFVLINGLKTREGEESREEVTVEQILPDGAVLSFEGHRFFQQRR